MGSGSSHNKKVNRETQFPASSKLRTRTPSPRIAPRDDNFSRRPYSSQPSPWLTKRHAQNRESNKNLLEYESIWETNGKLSSKFEQSVKSSSTNIEHDQKERNHKELVTKHTSKCESAEVESKLTTQFESIHNLSTSERIDTLMNSLKQTHTDFDQTVQQRIQQITSQTESILAQIVHETQENQQHLLIQAKEQQTIEDEQYRILLEEFIAKLDEKRAKQLALIQEKLTQQRLEIFNESQLKIRAVSEQANLIKNQIMFDEEKKTSEKIDSIVNEINLISTDSAIQQLGTQIKTQINLTLYEKVGSNKAQCEFNSDSDDQNINNKTNGNILKNTIFMSNQSSNQTTLQYPTSIKLSDHQTKTISKLTKQNS